MDNPADLIAPSLQKTFEYKGDDYDRIMLKDSLFDDVNSPNADIDSLSKTLKHQTIRECKQYLHAVTLSDYLRNKIIPRGLRIQKAPAIGLNNPIFCDRWCEILNKCSLDLMTLVIQETKDQLTKTKEEIQKILKELDSQCAEKECLVKLKKEVEQLKERYTAEIRTNKRKKFGRDTNDYKEGKVYFWRKVRDQTQTEQETARDHYQRSSPSGWPSCSSIDSTSSMRSNRDSFLGDPTLRQQRGRAGRRRHAGVPQRGRNSQRTKRNADGAYAEVSGRGYNTRSKR